MIQVILLILKIIGIILAVLLGLILLVLALVLFVPFFYRVHVVLDPEKKQVDGRVTYLFPLLSITFRYLEKFTYKGKLLWYVFLDQERPEKEKPEKAKKKKTKKKRKKKKTEPAGAPLQKDSRGSGKESAGKPAAEKGKPEKAGIEKEAETNRKVTVNQTGARAEEKKAGQEEENGPFFWGALRLKIEKIRDTIKTVIQKVKKLLHLKDEVLEILNKPSGRQAVSFAWGRLKQLVKHILPRKIKGYVVYGGKDPAATGQALAVLGVIYAMTGPLLEIRPDFEESRLECDVELKGRIQVFTLLVIVVKVLLNPELRELVSDFKGLKEADRNIP